MIKKRLMVYWWIGEGFIFPNKLEKSETPGDKKRDLEQLGAKVFDDLLKQQFLYSADGKHSQEVDNCKMLPFVCWAVIYIWRTDLSFLSLIKMGAQQKTILLVSPRVYLATD